MNSDEEKQSLLHHSQFVTPYNINSIAIAHSENNTIYNIYNINKTPKSEFTLYSRRWYILILFSLLSALQSTLWITYGAVADTSMAYYHKTAPEINFLASLGPIAYVPVATFFSWAIGAYGLRPTSLIAVVLCATCAVVRVFATGETFYIVQIAQFLNAAAGPLVMSAPPALSAAWFGSHERTLATAISSMANYLGSAFGFCFGLFVNNNKQLQYLLYIEGAAAVLIMIGFIIYFPNAPPTPPSATAAVKKQESKFSESFLGLLKDSWAVLKQKDGLVLVLVGGLTPGIYGGWAAMCVSILGPLGYSQTQAQWIALCSTIGGIVSALGLGWIHDRWRHFKIMMVGLFFATAATYTVFTMATSGVFHFHYFIELLLVSSFGGILINALYPISFEALVEVTYPIKEEVSVSLNTLLNNISCLVFLVAGDYIPPTWMNWVLVISTLASALATLAVKEEYKRSTIDFKAE